MGSGRSDSLSRRDRTSFSRGTASRGITDRPPASLPAHSFRSWAVRSEVAQCNAGRIRSPLGCGWQGLPSAALATPLGAVFPSTFPTGRPTLPLAEKGSNPTKLAQRRLVFAIGRVKCVCDDRSGAITDPPPMRVDATDLFSRDGALFADGAPPGSPGYVYLTPHTPSPFPPHT
jgi:hypothetical protein